MTSVEEEYKKLGIYGEAMREINATNNWERGMIRTIKECGGRFVAPNGTVWVLDENELPMKINSDTAGAE